MNTDDVRSAAYSFAISNTPMYLVARLRRDLAVQQLAKQSSRVLLHRLSRSLRTRPTTLDRNVLPYVYLVAISLRMDGNALRRAASYQAPYHKWYQEILSFLVATLYPTSIGDVSVIQAPTIAARQSSDAAPVAYGQFHIDAT